MSGVAGGMQNSDLREMGGSPVKIGICVPPPLLEPGRAEVELLRRVGRGIKKPPAIDPPFESLEVGHAGCHLDTIAVHSSEWWHMTWSRLSSCCMPRDHGGMLWPFLTTACHDQSQPARFLRSKVVDYFGTRFVSQTAALPNLIGLRLLWCQRGQWLDAAQEASCLRRNVVAYGGDYSLVAGPCSRPGHALLDILFLVVQIADTA